MTRQTAQQLVRELTWAESAIRGHGDRAAAEVGQSLARWQVLDSFSPTPRTVPGSARRLRQSRQAVQRIVDLLASEGLLAPRANPDHRTSPLYEMTESGAAKLVELDRSVADWHDFILSRMSEEEILHLTTSLARLRAIAEDYLVEKD